MNGYLIKGTVKILIPSSRNFDSFSKAPSTGIRMFLNPQLFLSGYGYRPHAYGEFARKSGNLWIRSPEWNFLNTITCRIRVDDRIRIFSDTMSSQNWRQYLPRKFKHSRRSKANSFCAPWAYFQSFRLYAAKCRSTKCWNKLCQQAAWHLQALYVIYRTKRPKQLKRVGKQCRPRRFRARPGRTSAWWDNFVNPQWIRIRVDGQIRHEFAVIT